MQGSNLRPPACRAGAVSTTQGDDSPVIPANHGVLESTSPADRHGSVTVFCCVCAVIVPRAAANGARLLRTHRASRAREYDRRQGRHSVRLSRDASARAVVAAELVMTRSWVRIPASACRIRTHVQTDLQGFNLGGLPCGSMTIGDDSPRFDRSSGTRLEQEIGHLLDRGA
jgi:hypothetical protein